MLVKPDRSFHSRLLAVRRLPAVRRLLALRSMPLALSLLLVLALLASLAPMPAEAAASSPVTCVTYHTVREGDTRVTISQVYRVKWLKIAQANGLREPYKLTPGQLLCIPAKETN